MKPNRQEENIVYNKLTEGPKAQWLKAIYSMSVSSEMTFFWKCNSLDPKKKEKQWSKTDLSTDELPHQPKQYPNSLSAAKWTWLIKQFISHWLCC